MKSYTIKPFLTITQRHEIWSEKLEMLRCHNIMVKTRRLYHTYGLVRNREVTLGQMDRRTAGQNYDS